MIAVDTNVVVRLLVQDDRDQGARAERLFASEPIFLPKTVLLETEWVLRRLYGFDASRVSAALRDLIALEGLRCEDRRAVLSALDWSARGLDFADALHLASSGEADGFASFDRALRQHAVKLQPMAVMEP